MTSDGVFLVQNGEIVEMSYSPYLSEVDLQELLERYPSLMSGRQVNPGNPREWLLIAREQGVPSAAGGADQWSADHLFVDQDGIPTIVEVKRSTDTRIRREVVGQMLDYAANGVRYWPVERLKDDLARRTGSDAAAELAIDDLLRRAGRIDTPPVTFWEQVEGNLRSGRLRLLFVADVIPDSLKRIIEFLNEQMAECEVLGIEIRQYRADGHQVLAPAVVGRTRGPSPESRTFDQLLAASSKAVRTVESRLSDLADQNGWPVTTSASARQYRAPTGWTLVQLYPGIDGGSAQFMLGGLFDSGLATTPELKSELEAIAGRKLGNRQPITKVEPLLENWDRFANRWLPRYAAAIAAVSAARRAPSAAAPMP